ncbi:FHA domain-containing protein [Nocardia sp. NBC_00881]|uniref:FHA domain-containing protein n=1 Tax=Nocardia sp. NBC_00881 TaxID=2975995 RepID=UPI0038707A2C|nr:FHA domain-containing protein [Nocardia sp. NBC_00881]
MITLEIPGWLAGMAAVLNFDWTGAEHIDVREGELADGIGNSWLDSAGMLRELVSLLREIRDEVPEFLEGESGAAVQENLDLLLRGDYSLDVLADAMEQMGNSVRDSAASFQSAKILQLLFAAMTLYTIYKLVALLMATPGGAALIPVMVPAVHAIGRESVRAASVKLTANLAADAARAWLKNVLMPLLKKIAVPLPMVGKILGNTMMKGAAFGGSLQLGTQGLQKATGQRDRWNTSEMVSFTLSYALAFPAGHWAAKGISPVVAGWSGPWWVRMMAVGAGSGVAGEAGGWAGGIAAQLASGAPRLDTTGFGLASVLAGVGEGSLEAVTEGKRASMPGHPQLPRVQPTAPALKPDHPTPEQAKALYRQLLSDARSDHVRSAGAAVGRESIASRQAFASEATAAYNRVEAAAKAGKPVNLAELNSLRERWVSTPAPQENRPAAASSTPPSTTSSGASTATDAGGSGSSSGAGRAAGGVAAGLGSGAGAVRADLSQTDSQPTGLLSAAVNSAGRPGSSIEVGDGSGFSAGEAGAGAAAGKQVPNADAIDEAPAPASHPAPTIPLDPAPDAVVTPLGATPNPPAALAAVEGEATAGPGDRGEPHSPPPSAATGSNPTKPVRSVPSPTSKPMAGDDQRPRPGDDRRGDTHTGPEGFGDGTAPSDNDPDKPFTIPPFEPQLIHGGAAAVPSTGPGLAGGVVSGEMGGRGVDGPVPVADMVDQGAHSSDDAQLSLLVGNGAKDCALYALQIVRKITRNIAIVPQRVAGDAAMMQGVGSADLAKAARADSRRQKSLTAAVHRVHTEGGTMLVGMEFPRLKHPDAVGTHVVVVAEMAEDNPFDIAPGTVVLFQRSDGKETRTEGYDNVLAWAREHDTAVSDVYGTFWGTDNQAEHPLAPGQEPATTAGIDRFTSRAAGYPPNNPPDPNKDEPHFTEPEAAPAALDRVTDGSPQKPMPVPSPVVEQLAELEGLRDRLLWHLGLDESWGPVPQWVPVREAIALSRDRLAADRKALAIEIGVPVEDLDSATLSGYELRGRDNRAGYHSKFEQVAQLERVLDRHESLLAQVGAPPRELMVPWYRSADGAENAQPNVLLVKQRIDNLTYELQRLAGELDVIDYLTLRPDSPEVVEVRRRAESDWAALAAEVRVDPAVLSDIDLKPFSGYGDIRNTNLARELDRLARRRAKIQQHLRFVDVVAEYHHARTVFDTEVSWRALSDEQIVAAVRGQTGVDPMQADRVNEHVLHVATAGSEPDVLLVFTTDYRPEATLDALVEQHPKFAAVLGPNPPFRVLFARLRVDERNGATTDAGIELDGRIEEVEPWYQEPTNAQIRSVFLQEYLLLRSKGQVSVGFDKWIKPLGRISAKTTLTDLAARLDRRASGPSDPFGPQDVARRLVGGAINGRDLRSRNAPPRGKKTGWRTVRTRIAGFPIEIGVDRDEQGGCRVAYQQFLSAEGTSQVVAAQFEGLQAADEKKLAKTIKAALRNPGVDIATAQSDTTQAEHDQVQHADEGNRWAWRDLPAAVATRLHHPEARLVAGVLAGRDVLAAEGAFPLGEGVGIVLARPLRIVVAAPVRELEALLWLTTGMSGRELSRNGITVTYHFISVDGSGQETVHQVPWSPTSASARPDVPVKYYDLGFQHLSTAAWHAAVEADLAPLDTRAPEPPAVVTTADGDSGWISPLAQRANEHNQCGDLVKAQMEASAAPMVKYGQLKKAGLAGHPLRVFRDALGARMVPIPTDPLEPDDRYAAARNWLAGHPDGEQLVIVQLYAEHEHEIIDGQRVGAHVLRLMNVEGEPMVLDPGRNLYHPYPPKEDRVVVGALMAKFDMFVQPLDLLTPDAMANDWLPDVNVGMSADDERQRDERPSDEQPEQRFDLDSGSTEGNEELLPQHLGWARADAVVELDRRGVIGEAPGADADLGNRDMRRDHAATADKFDNDPDYTLVNALASEVGGVSSAQLRERVGRIDVLAAALGEAYAQRQRAEANLTARIAECRDLDERVVRPGSEELNGIPRLRDAVRDDLGSLLGLLGLSQRVEDLRVDPAWQGGGAIEADDRLRELDAVVVAIEDFEYRRDLLQRLQEKVQELEQQATAIRMARSELTEARTQLDSTRELVDQLRIDQNNFDKDLQKVVREFVERAGFELGSELDRARRAADSISRSPLPEMTQSLDRLSMSDDDLDELLHGDSSTRTEWWRKLDAERHELAQMIDVPVEGLTIYEQMRWMVEDFDRLERGDLSAETIATYEDFAARFRVMNAVNDVDRHNLRARHIDELDAALRDIRSWLDRAGAQGVPGDMLASRFHRLAAQAHRLDQLAGKRDPLPERDHKMLDQLCEKHGFRLWRLRPGWDEQERLNRELATARDRVTTALGLDPATIDDKELRKLARRQDQPSGQPSLLDEQGKINPYRIDTIPPNLWDSLKAKLAPSLVQDYVELRRIAVNAAKVEESRRLDVELDTGLADAVRGLAGIRSTDGSDSRDVARAFTRGDSLAELRKTSVEASADAIRDFSERERPFEFRSVWNVLPGSDGQAHLDDALQRAREHLAEIWKCLPAAVTAERAEQRLTEIDRHSPDDPIEHSAIVKFQNLASVVENARRFHRYDAWARAIDTLYEAISKARWSEAEYAVRGSADSPEALEQWSGQLIKWAKQLDGVAAARAEAVAGRRATEDQVMVLARAVGVLHEVYTLPGTLRGDLLRRMRQDAWDVLVRKVDEVAVEPGEVGGGTSSPDQVWRVVDRLRESSSPGREVVLEQARRVRELDEIVEAAVASDAHAAELESRNAELDRLLGEVAARIAVRGEWENAAAGSDVDGSGPESGGIVGGDGSDVWRGSGVAPGGTRAVECLVKGLERVRANTGNTGAVGDLGPGEIGARGVFPLAAQRASRGEFCEVGAWGLLEQRLLRMEPGATFLVVRQLVDADSHEFGLSDRGPGSHVVVLSHSKEHRGKLEFFDPDSNLPWVYEFGQRPADLDLSEDGDKVAVLYDHQGVVQRLPGRPVLPMFPVAGTDGAPERNSGVSEPGAEPDATEPSLADLWQHTDALQEELDGKLKKLLGSLDEWMATRKTTLDEVYAALAGLYGETGRARAPGWMDPEAQELNRRVEELRRELAGLLEAPELGGVRDGVVSESGAESSTFSGATTPVPAFGAGSATAMDQLVEVEGRRDELLSKLGMRGAPGKAPTVPVREAIATAREQLEAVRAELAIRVGDVRVEDLDKVTLSRLEGLRLIDNRDSIRSRLAELTRLEQILDRQRQLMAELGVPQSALLVSVPAYGTVRGVENIRPDVELLDLRIEDLNVALSRLGRELGAGDVLSLRPDSPGLVELRRRAEADRRALADELSVDPVTLADIDPKQWLRRDSLRNTWLAGVLLGWAERRTAIERRLRFVELVAERHHARAVFDREMSRRAMADEQVVAQVLRRSGLTPQRPERVSEHVLHLRTAETEPDVLVVFTTAHRPDAALDALAENPGYASVLGPNPPYRVVFARLELDTSSPSRSDADVGIEIDKVETLEPGYREPDNTQIRAVLLEAYLDHRAEGKLRGVDFGTWIRPLGRVDARTTLAVLAGRVGDGPYDPYSAQEVARKLVSREINGRYLVYEPPSGGLRGGRSIRIEIAGFPIDIVMNRDRDGVYRVVYRSFGDGNGPSQVLAARFGNLRTTISERELAGAVEVALRDPDVEIAVAQPGTLESEVGQQPQSIGEARPDPAWKAWEPGAGRGAWPAAVATRLHHPEARLAAGVLAARDVIAGERGVRLGEGVTLVLGKVPRIVVAAPVAGLGSVLRQATGATSSQLAEAGITVIYHHVSVDDQGQVTVRQLPRSPKPAWLEERAVYYSRKYSQLGTAAWNAATEAGLAHLDTRPVMADPVFTTADGDTDWSPPLAQAYLRNQCAVLVLAQMQAAGYAGVRLEDLGEVGPAGVEPKVFRKALGARLVPIQRDPADPDDPHAAIKQRLLEAGDGAQAAILHEYAEHQHKVIDGKRVGAHVFRLVNVDGEVMVFDPGRNRYHPYPPVTDRVVVRSWVAEFDKFRRAIEPLTAEMENDPLPSVNIGMSANAPDFLALRSDDGADASIANLIQLENLYHVPGQSSTRPTPAVPELDDLPPPNGMYRGENDRLLHRPGDRDNTYRTRDGKLHHITDPENTFRDEGFGLHNAKGHFIRDHLSEDGLTYRAQLGPEIPYQVKDPDIQNKIDALSVERNKQQINRDRAADVVKGHMSEFGIENIHELKAGELKNVIQDLREEIREDPSLSDVDKQAKLDRLREMGEYARKYNLLGVEMVATSKEMAELGGNAYAVDPVDRPGALLLTPFDGAFDGRDTFDTASYVPATENTPPTLLLVENKGVGSQLGSAMTETGRAQQGSPEYAQRTAAIDQNLAYRLRETLDQMHERGIDPESAEGQKLIKAKEELLRAYHGGTLRFEYHRVHADINGNLSVTKFSLERDGVLVQINNLGGVERARTPRDVLVSEREQILAREIDEQRARVLEWLNPPGREFVRSVLEFIDANLLSDVQAALERLHLDGAMERARRAVEQDAPLGQASKEIALAREHLAAAQRLELDSRFATAHELDLEYQETTVEKMLALDIAERDRSIRAELDIAERHLVERATRQALEYREIRLRDRARFVQHHMEQVRALDKLVAQGKNPDLTQVQKDFDAVQDVIRNEQEIEARAVQELGLNPQHERLVLQAIEAERARTLGIAESAFGKEIARQAHAEVLDAVTVAPDAADAASFEARPSSAVGAGRLRTVARTEGEADPTFPDDHEGIHRSPQPGPDSGPSGLPPENLTESAVMPVPAHHAAYPAQGPIDIRLSYGSDTAVLSVRPGTAVDLGPSSKTMPDRISEILSANHAGIGIDSNGRVWIRDNGAAGRVWVNEDLLDTTQQARLRSGDEIWLGHHKVVVDFDEASIPYIDDTMAYVATDTTSHSDPYAPTKFRMVHAVMKRFIRWLDSEPNPLEMRFHLGGESDEISVPFITGKSHILGKEGGPLAGLLAGHPAVSAAHVSVGVYPSGRAWIRDNHSASRTFVNGAEIEPRRKVSLRDGDTIGIGDLDVTVNFAEPTTPDFITLLDRSPVALQHRDYLALLPPHVFDKVMDFIEQSPEGGVFIGGHRSVMTMPGGETIHNFTDEDLGGVFFPENRRILINARGPEDGPTGLHEWAHAANWAYQDKQGVPLSDQSEWKEIHALLMKEVGNESSWWNYLDDRKECLVEGYACMLHGDRYLLRMVCGRTDLAQLLREYYERTFSADPPVGDPLGTPIPTTLDQPRALAEPADSGAAGSRSVSDEDRQTGRGSERLLASPLDPQNVVNRYGLPETQRRYLVDDYIKMWERQHGREMTPEEQKVLFQGCIGVTKIGIGQTELNSLPPMNLAFADPDSHRVIQYAENVLAPGEVANAEVRFWRKRLNEAKNIVRERGMNWSYEYSDGNISSASERIQYLEDNLERARAEAREIWSDLAKGHIKGMLDARREARIEGDRRTFEKVQNYVQKFKDILATRPADVGEFMRLVKADPELSQLRGVDYHLPTGDPSEWKPIIFSKHFWSGQELVLDSKGYPVVTEGGKVVTRATQTPDPTRFAPDLTTGQVNMSGDHNWGKPGYANFDYGIYDEQTGSWWHANHADYRVYSVGGDPLDPMKVYQSTPERFFSSYSDFDSAVICIGFVKNTE